MPFEPIKYWFLAGAVAGGLFLGGCAGPAPTQLTVSAASNLIPAFEELGRVFESETGITVVFNFGGSGKLARQLEQGAPADLFASADTAYVTRLAEQGIIDPASVEVYAIGRLVIWSRNPGALPQSPAELAAPRIERIAIANPGHAPYGAAAKAVLQTADLWDAMQPRLVMADNTRQTLTYAQTGDVSVALVPLSLVLHLNEGAFVIIDESLHPPIAQTLGVVAGSSNQQQARRFATFILSRQGQAILQQFGYQPAP
ncbi:MAG: molybdate ABC transporter substrate-binding protein [Anaerolineae bacterium]